MSVAANEDGPMSVHREQNSAMRPHANPWPQVRGWIVRHDRAGLDAALARLQRLAAAGRGRWRHD